MSTTSIEWTDATWNPVRGCSRVSSGCDHCYAMGQAHRFSGAGKPFEGLTAIRRGKVDWAGKARFVPDMLDAPLRWKEPRRIFVNSMSDLFHESLSNEEIAAVFGVMAACPQHTFQVLTKRPERAKVWFTSLDAMVSMIQETLGPPPTRPRSNWFLTQTIGRAEETLGRQLTPQDLDEVIPGAWPLPNVWLGVSIEDQKTADERIPLLLQCPAAVRFISAEPLLSPITMTNLTSYAFASTSHYMDCLRGSTLHSNYDGGAGIVKHPKEKLDWVIVGGESGPGARYFDVSWAHSIVEQCRSAEVACFVKQLGARPTDVNGQFGDFPNQTKPANKKGGDMEEWPESLRVRQFPEVRP